MSDIIDINVGETIEEVTINVTDNLITVNINKVTGGGGGTQTLAQTLDLGNVTGGENISISNGDAIILDNGSMLKKGTIDAGNGGAKGISQICGVGFEHKWEAGRLYIMNDGGTIIREVSHNLTYTPTATDDVTKGFVQNTRWILDNGDLYVCTDPTEGAAVWEFITGAVPTLQEVLDNNHDLVNDNFFAGTEAGDLNTGINVNALGGNAANNNTGENVNAFGNSAGLVNSFNNVNLFGNSATADEDGQTVLSKDGAIMARISTTDLTATQKYTLPDASGTIALTSDITTPTLQEVLDNNNDLVDGNNFQGTNAGLGNTGIFVNAFGTDACLNNIGGNVNALGFEASKNNEGDSVNAFGASAALDNIGININALGVNAASSNTGNAINALGNGAGVDNTGNAVNALGQETAVENIGNDVNALGFRAGVNNAFNNVNLFGETAQADENGQTVLSKDGTIMARISTTELTASRKYTLQDGDGTLAFLSDITGGGGSGGGASVSFYLNGSVSQGTIGGIAFREMDRTPILGAGTDFTINANGYIQSFITDANVPNQLEIPAGNWNFETYFSASSGGGSPSFYVELYKWNGTTLSLIASNSATPRLITDGTNIEAYFSALAVPQTTLLATDRLAVRIYVTHSGRTITLHTENSHLCQVITTFSTGLTALNGLTTQVQNLAVGTSGTDFAISSVTDTHTFNLPTASASNRGALSSTDWSAFNNKPDELQVVLLSQVYS
jgi:hypothetical protein